MNELIERMSRYRDGHFDRVLAPEGEILSFASPSHMDVVNVENAGAFFHKRKYPKLRRPYAACFLRSVVKVGGCQRDSCPFGNVRHPCRTPIGLFPTLTTVLGAA
jgi:hypothetical protein